MVALSATRSELIGMDAGGAATGVLLELDGPLPPPPPAAVSGSSLTLLPEPVFDVPSYELGPESDELPPDEPEVPDVVVVVVELPGDVVVVVTAGAGAMEMSLLMSASAAL